MPSTTPSPSPSRPGAPAVWVESHESPHLAAGPGSDDWIRVRRYPLLPGWLGVWQTTRAMVGLVRGAVAVPQIKEIAVELTQGAAAFDHAALVRRIVSGVQRRFRYVSDPRGVEELWSPQVDAMRHRTLGHVWGDCDDAAVWSAALARAVGVPVRFVTIANGKRGRSFNHVFTEAMTSPGRWMSMDFLSPDSPQIRRAVWPI
jgi:transglutaminase-like putative cysteine protease